MRRGPKISRFLPVRSGRRLLTRGRPLRAVFTICVAGIWSAGIWSAGVWSAGLFIIEGFAGFCVIPWAGFEGPTGLSIIEGSGGLSIVKASFELSFIELVIIELVVIMDKDRTAQKGGRGADFISAVA